MWAVLAEFRPIRRVLSALAILLFGVMLSNSVWGGPASPNWPAAITAAAALWFIAASAAKRTDETLPRDISGIVVMITLIVVSIAATQSIVIVSASCLALAAMLLPTRNRPACDRNAGRERPMIRNALLTVAASIVICAGFLPTFAMSQQTNEVRAVALGFPNTNFNWKTAHAQERGCNACHADNLATDVSHLVVPRAKPELHGIFVTSYGIPMRVEDCLICHGNSFAGSIHSLHLHAASFTKIGGNCDSCHAMIKGKFVLYDDESRYDVLNGVKPNPTPPFSQP